MSAGQRVQRRWEHLPNIFLTVLTPYVYAYGERGEGGLTRIRWTAGGLNSDKNILTVEDERHADEKQQ
jgi:hypothetical protein